MSKLLIVEDNEDLSSGMRKALVSDGHSVDVASNAGQAKHFVAGNTYDAIVLDWGLPDGSGIDLCLSWRASGIRSAILFLTANSRIDDREAGLDAGADDYLLKPFHIKELQMRVRTLLRRCDRELVDNVLRCGPLAFDATARLLTRDGQPIRLIGREYALLEFFMRHPGKVFSNEDLLSHVWTADEDSSPETVRTHIKNLRKKIDAPDQPSIIETVHAMGYRLKCGEDSHS